MKTELRPHHDRRSTLRALGTFAAVALVLHALAPREATAQPVLACGQILTGTIATLGQQHQFTIPGAAGDVVSVTLVETSSIDPAFLPVVTLAGPSLSSTRSPGVSVFTLPATAVYTVTVRDVSNAGRGSYALRVGWVLPVSKQCGDRTPLACGQEVEGAISAPMELDLFSFAGQAGSVVTVTLQHLASMDVGFQVHGRLLDPNGVDLGFVAQNSTRTATLPATGTYVVPLHDLGNFTRRGTYRIGLGAQGPCPPPPMPPSFGIGLNGTAFPPGATMTLTGTLSAGNVSGPVDAYIVLRLPTGQFLSLQLGGGLVAGIVPIAQGFAPFDFAGPLVQHTFTGGEPPGIYRWLAVLTAPGTLTFVSPLQEVSFTVP